MTTLPQATTLRLPRPTGGNSLSIPYTGAPAIAASAGAYQMTGSDVLRVLRSNAWLIILLGLVSAITGYGVNSWLQRYHSRYTAMGIIQQQPPVTDDPLHRQAFANDSPSFAVEIRTTAELLKTPSLITEILQQPDSKVRQTTWFQSFASSPMGQDQAAKADLMANFSVQPLTDSKLIAVSMTDSHPKDTAIIVTAMVDQFINDQNENRHNKQADQTLELQHLLNRYTQNLADQTIKVRADGAALNINSAGSSDKMGQIELEMGDLLREGNVYQIELNDAKQKLADVNQQISDGRDPMEIIVKANLDPQVQQYRGMLGQIQLEKILGESRQGSDSPMAKGIQDQMSAVQQMLDQSLATAKANARAELMDTLQNALISKQRDLDLIKVRMTELRAQMGDLSNQMANYLVERDTEIGTRELVKEAGDKLIEMGNVNSNPNVSGVEWATHPETPDSPSFPRLSFTMSVSVMVGLALALAIAFARELTDTSVRSPRDVSRIGNINLLGMVTHEADDPQSAGANLPLVIFEAPHSIMAEQLRQVRTRLQHASSLDTTRSMLITGPSPDDGKTTIACNLAAGLALNGRRILLVDANFRRPQLQNVFGLPNETGFADVLNSIDNFEQTVQETNVPNLFVLTTGVKPTNVTELLESQLLIDFIERALEEFDHVIFDSGPLLFVSETVALAPRVDGVITVVRARSNSRGVLQRMRDTLRQNKAEHLGVVLNAVRAQGGGYYGRNIRTYYAYQNGKRPA